MATANTSTWENPYLRNIERAPAELCNLLQKLPDDFSALKPAKPEAYLIAEAAITHASNARGNLLRGLEALGMMMFYAETNNGFDVDRGNSADIALLISHIAIEAQAMFEVEDYFRHVLRARAALAESPKRPTQ